MDEGQGPYRMVEFGFRAGYGQGDGVKKKLVAGFSQTRRELAGAVPGVTHSQMVDDCLLGIDLSDDPFKELAREGSPQERRARLDRLRALLEIPGVLTFERVLAMSYLVEQKVITLAEADDLARPLAEQMDVFKMVADIGTFNLVLALSHSALGRGAASRPPREKKA